MHDIKENKSENVCERNFEGRFFEELLWRVVQQITSDEDHDCFGKLSSNSPWRVVQYFYRNSVVSFREQKNFVLKTVILLAFGLGMCEGVGEDSRHEIRHVDIQVRSWIYLSVIVFHDMCT